MAKLLSVFLLLFSFSAMAEYRVFLLEFRNKEGQVVRQVKSTLDPYQYPIMYLVPLDQTISYSQTWMCRENTSFKPLCKSPQEIALEKAESGAEEGADTRAPSSEK